MHTVVTVLHYNTIRARSGTVPENAVAVPENDVFAAARDMDRFYALCPPQGRLSQLPIMLVSMTKEALEVITKKKKMDPPVPLLPEGYAFRPDAAAALAGGSSVVLS